LWQKGEARESGDKGGIMGGKGLRPLLILGAAPLSSWLPISPKVKGGAVCDVVAD